MDAQRTAAESENITATIRELGAQAEPYVIERRRHFHQHPEPSLQEFSTTDDIARELDAMGIPYTRPLETGLVATLAGTAADAYRADRAHGRGVRQRERGLYARLRA